MKKIWLIVIGCALIILITGIVQFLFPHNASAPQPTELESLPVENTNATTTDSKTTPTDIPNKPSVSVPISTIEIQKGDNIISWNFNGAYTNNPDLIAKAESEIDRLSDLIDSGEYTNMILHVSIANQYGLLGDGKHEYEYLGYAIKEGGTTTGLPWHNLGVLMERLGAFKTARIAYEKATLVQSELKQWHYSYLSFLTDNMKEDATNIEKAFSAAIENIGQDSDILQIYSELKNS